MIAETYYLTLRVPTGSEQIVASVVTSDRILSEKLFACGIYNEKGFCFKGLYTEDEAKCTFKPGSDVIGTYNPQTCQCKKHKDYTKMPKFLVLDDQVFRVKNDERFLIPLSIKQSDFDYVNKAISGKLTDTISKSVLNDVPQVLTVQENEIATEVVEPEFDDTWDNDMDMFDNDSLYSLLLQEKQLKTADPDYISDFDAVFYNAQKHVSSEAN